MFQASSDGAVVMVLLNGGCDMFFFAPPFCVCNLFSLAPLLTWAWYLVLL